MPSSEALSLFINDLKLTGFKGDIESSYPECVIASTDNSIYQLIPQAILYPLEPDDINRVMSCVLKHRKAAFTLCARGGGTGTNGQSLSDNLILDCSRHLTKIIDFNRKEMTVTVQPGVILDQLNNYLKPYGLFFPIDISSSSRATLGGMVATDASGKGSLIYGKTSNHIVSLKLVLADGSSYHAEKFSVNDLAGNHSEILNSIYPLLEYHRDEIDRIFPQMDRCLTGYNLKHCISEPAFFNPCYLIAGSEGTLALTREITLRVIPKPTHKMLTVIFYDNFLRGLEHVQPLLECKPAAIEMLDDKILNLARSDIIWTDVKSVLNELPENIDIKAANFVEHTGNSKHELEQYQQHIQKVLDKTTTAYRVIHCKTETSPAKISALWNLRKKAVGLLGQSLSGKRGIAFVEDTAVPPQNLAHYVTDFKQLLDNYNLQYGLYGHADAGVLHVRPALDLLHAKDRQLIRKISDKVAQLAKQHGGVLWGEHGRGFRGEYSSVFFGEQLHPVLCDIKYSFDPYNLLNPGKITTIDKKKAVIALDEITFRGELDAQISSSEQQTYADSIACNGNAACHNWQLNEAMCPSYKATRNKLYSPKGRAALFREWLRLKNTKAADQQCDDLEKILFISLQHCLSCQSCASSCSLKVDIAELKSKFLQLSHISNSKPLATLFIRYFDTLISSGRLFPRLSNAFIHSKLGSQFLQAKSGLNRLPLFSVQYNLNSIVINSKNRHLLSDNSKTVILLRDNYLQCFDLPTLQAAIDVLHKLGFQVYLSELIENGKLLQVKGYRKEFRQQAKTVQSKLQMLSSTGLPLISLETVSRLLIDKEYVDSQSQQRNIKVHSIESFLIQLFKKTERILTDKKQQPVTLLPHCQEQTSARESSQNWQSIFSQLGIELTVINAGCCGMSGLFGHEVENNKLSDTIFELVWKPTLQSTQGVLLASGFSCRCQTKNKNLSTIHPLVYLAELLQQHSA